MTDSGLFGIRLVTQITPLKKCGTFPQRGQKSEMESLLFFSFKNQASIFNLLCGWSKLCVCGGGGGGGSEGFIKGLKVRIRFQFRVESSEEQLGPTGTP